MQLRDGKTKITLNEAAASNAPEGESKNLGLLTKMKLIYIKF